MTILDRYVIRRFLVVYGIGIAALIIVTLGAQIAHAPESGILDIFPAIAVPATMGSAVTLSELSYGRELEALYSAGISLMRVTAPLFVASCILPTLGLLAASTEGHVYQMLLPASLAAGSSLVGVSAAAIASAQFARREPGVVWLASAGTLTLFGFVATRYTDLGDHPIFETSCTAILTIAMLSALWYVHRNWFDFV